MRKLGIPLCIFALCLSGCSRPVSIGGLYILESYDGANPVLEELVGSLGIYVEAYESEEQGPGYAFVPVLVSEGQLQPIADRSIAEPPWRLSVSPKNRYEIPLFLDKQYAWDAKAKPDSLRGKLQGIDERGVLEFKLTEGGE